MDSQSRATQIEALKKRFDIDTKIAAKSGRTVHQVAQDFDQRIQRIFSALPKSYFEEKEPDIHD